jgi:hypoxanthine phosphoribosyltransferase
MTRRAPKAMPARFRCELVPWSRVVRLARRLAFDIRAAGFQPDLIVAIARGGYVPARLLADYLGVMNVVSFRIEHYRRGARQQPAARVKYPLAMDVSGLRVLVVDDVGDTGDTFVAAMRHLRQRGRPSAIRTAVLHYKAGCRYTPDFCARQVVRWHWITYPWAVIEDLTGFIERMEKRPATLAGLARRLERDYGIKVSHPTLKDVFALMTP